MLVVALKASCIGEYQLPMQKYLLMQRVLWNGEVISPGRAKRHFLWLIEQYNQVFHYKLVEIPQFHQYISLYSSFLGYEVTLW